jgi:hypothetical protein
LRGGASPLVVSVASSDPTGTFWPFSTRISSTTPEAKISTSMSLFAVSMTATMSPRCTRSPGRTSHLLRVPASMSAPREGMRNSYMAR